MSDLNSRILAYQTSRNDSVIDDIIGYVEGDLRKYRITGQDGFGATFRFKDPAMYIAYRVQSLINRLYDTLGLSDAPDDSFDIEDLYWYRKELAEWFGYDLTPADRFAAFYDNRAEIEQALDPGVVHQMDLFFKRYAHYAMIRYERAELQPLIIRDIVKPSLEQVLNLVDTNRTPKETVTYVNKALNHEFARRQQDVFGIKRLGRQVDGEFRNVFVLPEYAHGDSWRMIFGDVPHDRAYSLLTESQRKLVDDIHRQITFDFEQGDREGLSANYKVDDDGSYKIMYEYMANKLDMESSNLRKRLSSIRNKVAEKLA